MRLAAELHPVAITLDVVLPNLDGWSVISSLNADPALASIPVIFLTMMDQKFLGYSLGACRFPGSNPLTGQSCRGPLPVTASP